MSSNNFFVGFQKIKIKYSNEFKFLYFFFELFSSSLHQFYEFFWEEFLFQSNNNIT